MMGGIIVGTVLTLLFLPALMSPGSGSRRQSPLRTRRPVAPGLQPALVADAPSHSELENA